MPVSVPAFLDRRVNFCLDDAGAFETLPRAHELNEHVRLLLGAVAVRDNVPTGDPERSIFDDRVEVFRRVAEAGVESLFSIASQHLVGNVPLKDVDSIQFELGSLDELLHTHRGSGITKAEAQEFARVSEDIMHRVDRATSVGIARCLAREFEKAEREARPEVAPPYGRHVRAIVPPVEGS